MRKRIQLSLYVPEPSNLELERVRRILDPVQAGLIPAHVTLCREDELVDIDLAALDSRLSKSRPGVISLQFGKPESFHQHGILLPCIAGEEAFHALRLWVLNTSVIRRQMPHITLAHPRNPKFESNTDDNISKASSEFVIQFPNICLIQQEGASAWKVLREYPVPINEGPARALLGLAPRNKGAAEVPFKRDLDRL